MQVSDFKTSAWQSKERAESYHDSTMAANRLFQLLRHDMFLRCVERFATPGANILDLGCGSGLISSPLHDRGHKVVACDVSDAMLEKASENFGSRAIEIRKGSGFCVPARDGEFDMVVSRMFMAHFPDWKQILIEKARVTRPGGFVIFDFGNREHLTNFEPGQDFPYGNDVNNPNTFYAVASEGEMHAAALACGLGVVDIVPHGVLLYNVDFYKAVGSRGVDEFNSKLDRLLEHEQARELLLFLEESFVSHLPKRTAYGSLVILRRNVAA